MNNSERVRVVESEQCVLQSGYSAAQANIVLDSFLERPTTHYLHFDEDVRRAGRIHPNLRRLDADDLRVSYQVLEFGFKHVREEISARGRYDFKS